eukprot:3266150-Rhodomonas_salina.1
MQSVCSELPGTELLFPGHWYVWFPPGHQYPSAHSVHCPPHAPSQPVLHRQSVASSLLAGEFELAEQFVKSPPEQNVFGGHAVHGPPAGPWSPSRQMQSVS